jgi:5-methylcytosine-specific restriction endonuclease McrA
MSVVQLAERDGPDCGICGEPVDLDAPTTDPMRPSVDHIWPRARGGTNDPANLQIAHLRCNNHKKDRLPA